MRAAAAAQLRDDLLCEGLISEATHVATFTGSDAAVEAGNPEAWRQARDWPCSPRPSMRNAYICGPIGTGKTHMARCMLNKAIDCGLRAGEVTAVQFCEAVTDNNLRHISRWRSVPVLLLDDIDKAAWRERALAQLWGLLDYRYGRTYCRTIVTTNMDSRDLRAMFQRAAPDNPSIGASLLDRLAPCLKLTLEGKSLRYRQATPATAG